MRVLLHSLLLTALGVGFAAHALQAQQRANPFAASMAGFQERVKAYISLRPGADTAPAELAAYCKERLAAYKYPRQVEVLPDLPKTASGKILRRELRSRPHDND